MTPPELVEPVISLPELDKLIAAKAAKDTRELLAPRNREWLRELASQPVWPLLGLELPARAGPRMAPAGSGIMADLRRAIETGELAAGTMLPSRTELATRYGVSTHVAGGAITRLRAAGLIVRLTAPHVNGGTRMYVTAPSERAQAAA